MSDPGCPLGSRLMYDQLSESRHPFNENLTTGLRLGFTSISVYLILMRSLQGVLRLHKAQLWCMFTLWNKKILPLIFHGTLECIAGSSQLHDHGF